MVWYSTDAFGLIYRWDCDGALLIRDPKNNFNTMTIYLTNTKQFLTDYVDFARFTQNDAVYFDADYSEGFIYTSYTYIPNSMKEVPLDCWLK